MSDKFAAAARRAAAEQNAMRGKKGRLLAELKDRNKGRTVFVVGNGPSVRTEDLDLLHGAPVIATNRFHLSYPRLRLRPDYTVASGEQLMANHGQRILRDAGTPVLIPEDDRARLNLTTPGDAAAADDQETAHEELTMLETFAVKRGTTPAFRPNPKSGFADAGLTGFFAMQLAAWTGAKRIVLYGFDLTFTISPRAEHVDDLVRDAGERNHFIAGYRDRGELWRPLNIDAVMAAMDAAHSWAKSKKTPIVNATRGGALEAFPRVELRDELSDADFGVELFLKS